MGCVAFTIKRVIRLIFDVIVTILNLFLPSRPGRGIIPPIKSRLLFDSCVQLASKIRSREVAVAKVITTFINRIQEVEPFVNSIVDSCFNEALQRANHLDSLSDEEFRHECLGHPFLGVPFVGKDTIASKGLSLTAGLVWRKGFKSPNDAESVGNLKAAGFIILGVTNTPELGLWFDSHNHLYGRSNNPHNLGHIPGGSTGGGAACLAYAGSPLTVGSDIGGSIRMPAFFNGTFGHKYTSGWTAGGDHFPEINEDLIDLFGFGPLVRSSEDLIPLSRYFIGEEKFKKMKLDSPIDSWEKKRIFILSSSIGEPLASPVQQEITTAINSVGKLFSTKYKAEVTYGLPQDIMSILKHAFDIFDHRFRSEKNEKITSMLKVTSLKTEWIKLICGQSNHTIPVLYFATKKHFGTKQGDPRILQMGRDLKRLLNDLLGDDGLLILPTHPTSAPKHHTTIPLIPNIVYTSIFNVTGSPGTSCPLGFDNQGLPIGCQIVGAADQDRLCMNAAVLVEQEFGGWMSPSPIEIHE